jgi:hypothetical protein
MKIHLMHFPDSARGSQPVDVENIMSIGPVSSRPDRNSSTAHLCGYYFYIYPKIGSPLAFGYDIESSRSDDAFAIGVKGWLEKERTKLIEAWEHQ